MTNEAEEQPPRGRGEDDRAAREHRTAHQARWVDLLVQRAIERGEFDDLPGAGKPLPDDGADPDPDWWIRKLVERERISVLPPALALRNEDARMDETLDAEASERRVREVLEEFNDRVVEARRQLQGGPPVITGLRDVEHEVRRWQERRRAAAAARTAARRQHEQDRARQRWWRRAADRRARG